MEAIKNLRESSVLLSSLSFDSYRDVANLIYGYDNVADVCDIISCSSEYVDTLVGMVTYNAELRNKCVYDALVAYATEDDYRAIYAEFLAMKGVDGAARGLYATMSNDGDRSEEEKGGDIPFKAGMDDAFSTPEKKEERVLTPEEEEAAYDAWYEAEFGNCPCHVIPEEDDDERQPYDFFASLIYDFNYAMTYVGRKPSDDLDIKYIKRAVLHMAFATGGRNIVESLHRSYNNRDYREIYRELYVKLNNDIADIEEDLCLQYHTPYRVEIQDGHRVVHPIYEQTIEADKIKEAAFISDKFEVSFDEEAGEYNTIYTGKSKYDEDFDLILDEETGKVKMYRDHYRLTEEDYKEMERLEADNSYDPIAKENHYPADDLPF